MAAFAVLVASVAIVGTCRWRDRSRKLRGYACFSGGVDLSAMVTGGGRALCDAGGSRWCWLAMALAVEHPRAALMPVFSAIRIAPRL